MAAASKLRTAAAELLRATADASLTGRGSLVAASIALEVSDDVLDVAIRARDAVDARLVPSHVPQCERARVMVGRAAEIFPEVDGWSALDVMLSLEAAALLDAGELERSGHGAHTE